VFSLRFTVLLAGLLALPLALRALVGVEPYPAILLPDGATLSRTDQGVVRFGSLALFALRANGEEVRLDPRSFMDPVPVHYLPPLAARGFGQGRPGQRTLSFGSLGVWQLDAKRATEAERARAWQWLAGRVFAVDREATALLVRAEGYRVELETGKWHPPESLSEFKVSLR
jgi:hypothetical protein